MNIKNNYHLNLTKGVKSISEKSFLADKYSIYPFKTKLGRNDSENDNILLFNRNGNIKEQNLYFYNRILNSDHNYKFEDYHSQKWIFDYDELNRKIKKTISDNYDKIYMFETYEYQNNKIIINTYERDDYLLFMEEHLLDDKGRTVTVKFFNEFKEFEGYKNYVFNKKNDITKELNDDFLEKTIFEYDNNRNIIKTKLFVDDTLDTAKEFKYKFDPNGNWIERVEYQNEKPIHITEREVEYFEK